eukprot:scaffold57656_cov63-Phaeocystis_antarctica.AAC.3
MVEHWPTTHRGMHERLRLQIAVFLAQEGVVVGHKNCGLAVWRCPADARQRVAGYHAAWIANRQAHGE